MDAERFAALDARIDGLSQSMGSAAQMAASFEGELRRVRGAFKDTGKEIGGLERGLSNGLRRAFGGLLNDGESLSDAFDTIASSIVRSTYNAAMTPATDQLSSTIAGGLGQLMDQAMKKLTGGEACTILVSFMLLVLAAAALSGGLRRARRRWRRRDQPHHFPDARCNRAEWRGGAGSDHAPVPRAGWQAGGPRIGQRRAGGQRGDEHLDAGCRQLPPVAGPDRGADGPDAGPRQPQPLEQETRHELS